MFPVSRGAMALNKIGDQISSSIRDIFAPEGAAPPCKKERKDTGRADTCKTEEDSASSAGQTRAASPSAKPPFNKLQLDWMGQAVSQSNEAVIKIFGEHVEERFKSVEAEITTQGEKIAALEREMQELKSTKEAALDRGDPRFAQELADLKKQVDSTVKRQAEDEVSAASQSQAAQQDRTAIMGNLGWDTEAEELEKRCNEVLRAAALPPEKIVAMASTRRDGGSACEILFDTSDSLEEAKIKVKASRKKFGDKMVWLDRKRAPGDSRNRPVRLMHRCHDFLERCECEREGGPRKVEKNTSTRTVRVDSRIVGYPKDGAWFWCSSASEVLGDEVMHMAKAYAEGQ